MTTIACFDGWLAADGRYVEDTYVLDDSSEKIYTRPDGIITTGAGEGGPLESFMKGGILDSGEWPPGMGPMLEPEMYHLIRKCTCWAFRPGDNYIYQSGKNGFDPLPVRDGYAQAIGTGAAYFKGSLNVLKHMKAEGQLQMTSRQMVLAAMETASRCDLYTGPNFTVVKLK